jgi:hypothetical protein
MATTVTPEAMYFGSPASLTIGGTEVGVSEDNPQVTFDVTIETPDLPMAVAPIEGLDFVTKVIPHLKCTVTEIVAAKIGWAMPGSASVVGTAATTGGGCAGTLYADCAVGATNIKVTSVTSLTAGDFLKIGDVGETEVHEVLTVGTINGGTGVDLVTPLLRAHDAGDAYEEVDDAGTTIYTWTAGRVPAASYKDVIATGTGLDGRQLKVTIQNALNSASFEFEMGNKLVGIPLDMVGHAAAATPSVAPFIIEAG